MSSCISIRGYVRPLHATRWSVRWSHTSWISEKWAEFEKNSIRNKIVCHLKKITRAAGENASVVRTLFDLFYIQLHFLHPHHSSYYLPMICPYSLFLPYELRPLLFAVLLVFPFLFSPASLSFPFHCSFYPSLTHFYLFRWNKESVREVVPVLPSLRLFHIFDDEKKRVIKS